MWHYGARDYRNIGHKAIYSANAWRTLNTIGWQHAEPVLRSLVLSLADFGPKQELNGFAFENQCYRANIERLKSLQPKPGWEAVTGDTAATESLVTAIRQSSPDEVCGQVATQLNNGKLTAGSIWDAVHLAAGELRMRARGGAALGSVHAVTSANGLHNSWLAATGERTRLLLALQAVGWMTQFRTAAGARPENLRDLQIASLERQDGTLEQAWSDIGANNDAAAARLASIAASDGGVEKLFAGALRLVVTKAEEVHFYKYLAALMEDVPLASRAWQPKLAATAAYYLKGPGDRYSAVATRAMAALKA